MTPFRAIISMSLARVAFFPWGEDEAVMSCLMGSRLSFRCTEGGSRCGV